ncbi:hypothetical protein Scel_24350 [Streptomyces cellostaticus]|nr:hypothetical protein Scel_24350 [Streptomyces cellostaticus]
MSPWAPEVSDDATPAESVSMAMLLVLETLKPTERAVFVLHEVFGCTHGEIATAIGKTEVSVRQTAHRARQHVHARRRRFEPDSDATRKVIQRCLRATRLVPVQLGHSQPEQAPDNPPPGGTHDGLDGAMQDVLAQGGEHGSPEQERGQDQYRTDGRAPRAQVVDQPLGGQGLGQAQGAADQPEQRPGEAGATVGP